MTKKIGACISAVGGYAPPKIVTNHDLAKVIDTSHSWIVRRTGIVQRRKVEPGTPVSELASFAAMDLIRQRGIEADEIDLIIVCTVTPDMSIPATACIVQEKIRASKAWGFDLSAACSGFLYGMNVGAKFIETGAHKKAIVIGAEVMSSIINIRDRASYVLFGDGAGAVLLEPSDSYHLRIFDYLHEMDGSGSKHLYLPGGGSLCPASHDTVDSQLHYVHQNGPQVFKFAVRKLEQLSRQILNRNNLSIKDIDLFIVHQANMRIIDEVAWKLGLSNDQLVTNIQKYGNTGSATIPLLVKDALSDGRLKRGDTVLFATTGAGFTSGAALARWGY